jgi:hypothetical protein
MEGEEFETENIVNLFKAGEQRIGQHLEINANSRKLSIFVFNMVDIIVCFYMCWIEPVKWEKINILDKEGEVNKYF